MLRRILISAAVAALAALALAAQAGERVTLRNGFALSCDHHTQTGSRVRLYLGTGEDNFIEFAAEDIASVDAIPDPPAAADAAPPAPAPTARVDAHLTQGDLAEMLARVGSAHNLDVDLLESLVEAESGGNPRPVPPAGARGLMQLMPATASGLGVSDSFRPDQNVSGGTAYLDALLTRYHNNLALALAAYNAGPAAVDKYHGIPPYHETRAYVARVIHEFNRRVLARETAARVAVR
jgi:soluble lytic murein transglycosylase-like protein